MRACIGRFLGIAFPQRTRGIPEDLFSVGGFQIALPPGVNPIILTAKAGIDPVGASYPKVSCPP
jgi:hypothetical protein